MKIILTSEIKNIGQKGDIKEVKPGYARNFLFPKDLAVPADSARGQEIIKIKETESEKQGEEIGKIAELVRANQNFIIKFERKASSEGKLFGSVAVKEIKVAAEKKLGTKVESLTPDHPVKEIGDHKYNLGFKGQQTLDIIVSIVPLSIKKK